MAYRYEEQISVHPILKIAYGALLLAYVVFTLGERDHTGVFLIFLPSIAILIAIPLLFGCCSAAKSRRDSSRPSDGDPCDHARSHK